MAKERLGVRLDDVPEWLGNAAIAYEAIDKRFTALAEDERLEAYGAPPKEERRAYLIKLKEGVRERARMVARMTGGGLMFSQGIWTEDMAPKLKDAPPDEKQEFYRPHIEGMKVRLTQLIRSLKEGGKRVPDEVGGVVGDTIIMLDTKTIELYRMPVKKVNLLVVEAGMGDRKNLTPAPSEDWFRIRWDDALLQNTKGISEKDRVRIIAKAHLET